MPVSSVAATTDSSVLVSLDRVSKVFANGTRALADISFSISPGEFVSFLGPSGCGKSTVLRLIAGLDTPSTGSIAVARAGEARTANGDVAFVFQDPTLLPWLSVERNVALPLTLAHRPRIEIRAAVRRVLDLVGLQGHAKDLPRQLSGGMRMRVSIARALVARPRLLLMDEPFAALDEITRQDLQDELLSIFGNSPDTSVLFVTHNVFEAAYLSSRVVVLGTKPGRVVADLAGHPARLERSDGFRSSTEFVDLVTRVSDGLTVAAAPR